MSPTPMNLSPTLCKISEVNCRLCSSSASFPSSLVTEVTTTWIYFLVLSFTVCGVPTMCQVRVMQPWIKIPAPTVFSLRSVETADECVYDLTTDVRIPQRCAVLFGMFSKLYILYTVNIATRFFSLNIIFRNSSKGIFRVLTKLHSEYRFIRATTMKYKLCPICPLCYSKS